MTKERIIEIAHQSMRGTDYVPNTSEPGAMYHLFIASLAKEMEAKRVVELGTYIGETAKSVGLAVPDCEVWTIDTNPGCKGSIEVAEPIVPNVTAITDNATKVSQFYDGKPIDLLFIDINHDFSTTQAAYEAWQGLVRSGGLIVVDDIHLDKQTKLFNHYLQDRNIELIDIPEVHKTGMGCVLKS